MVSLYDSLAMFPTGHHHHHSVGVGMTAVGSGGHGSHPILTRHGHPGSQLNLHQHHQGVNQATYFSYSHPHHYGQSAAAAAQYGANMMGNVTATDLHPQQFPTVGGLVTADGTSWHTPAVYSGLSGLSPRTPATVGYEEWANSPNNNNTSNAAALNGANGATANPNNSQGGVVSSPDGSPSVLSHFTQSHGSVSPVGIGYPTSGSAYGKLFVSTGGHGTDFPHHIPIQGNHDIVSITPLPQRMNPMSCNNVGPSSGGSNVTSTGGGPGHHSPDSGLAGSDGLSSAGSPAQQQQQGILGSNSGPMINMNTNNTNGVQQQSNGVVSNSLSMHHNSNLVNISRPQPSRSPFEWMKKPSYHNQTNPAGKTRTKDKYRVVYTDHQRLELEKEFHYSRYITIRRKSELASVLGLSERQVKIWFQNRRAKERKQVKKREEMMHKEKLDVVSAVTHPHGIHSHPSVAMTGNSGQVSVSIGNHGHLTQQIDTKPVLGLE